MQSLPNWTILASLIIIASGGFVGGYVWRLLNDRDSQDPRNLTTAGADCGDGNESVDEVEKQEKADNGR